MHSYVLCPLGISRVGSEPDLNIVEELDEDMSLLGKKYVGMSSKRRKAHFSRRKTLVKHFYDPNLIYTFDIYQHILNLATFQGEIGVIKYDLLKFLGEKLLSKLCCNRMLRIHHHNSHTQVKSLFSLWR